MPPPCSDICTHPFGRFCPCRVSERVSADGGILGGDMGCGRAVGLRRLLGSDELVVLPEPLFDLAVWIGHIAGAIHLAILKLTDVLATIAEDNCPLPIEIVILHLADVFPSVPTVSKRKRSMTSHVPVHELPRVDLSIRPPESPPAIRSAVLPLAFVLPCVREPRCPVPVGFSVLHIPNILGSAGQDVRLLGVRGEYG